MGTKQTFWLYSEKKWKAKYKKESKKSPQKNIVFFQFLSWQLNKVSRKRSLESGNGNYYLNRETKIAPYVVILILNVKIKTILKIVFLAWEQKKITIFSSLEISQYELVLLLCHLFCDKLRTSIRLYTIQGYVMALWGQRHSING